MKKISVIISNYNYGHFLNESIQSVLNCEGDFLHEIIVVDDGSTDDSKDILLQHYGAHEKVKPVIKENGGQFSCFRKGIEIATGDILCFLDPDDRYEPGYFKHLSEVYEAKPYIDLVYVGYQNVGKKTEVILKASQDFPIGITAVRVGLTGTLFGSLTSALSMNRYLAKKILSLPSYYDWDWKVSGDIVLQLGGIILGGYAYYLAKPLMRRMIHDTNAVANRTEKDPIEEYKYQAHRRRLMLAFVKNFNIVLDDVRLIEKEFERLPTKDFKLSWKYVEAVKKMRAPVLRKFIGAFRVLMAYFS
ncbi:glycosyl transferase family 2 [Chloroherpeton thalassium ATCC 35110]|uniref:Glycosyl transferase family 2 n=1 Tax=Chloroherpeton thalassium (strain ATCC 35110 / GB-78) TaxID=517418 RepID=B3QXX8_CHLT3|nr:glycosyltransferase family A protein [Chloroherpeton thalassium]ACF13506.1 glycosyl transferase family 2 [Chloroherpeton thalassium ATCC 35110]